MLIRCNVKGSSLDPLQGTYIVHYTQREWRKVLKSAGGIHMTLNQVSSKYEVILDFRHI